MIVAFSNTIDSADKIGDLPPLADAAATWISRFPLWNGRINVGTYTVPANTRFKLKGFQVFGQYTNIPRLNALAGFALANVYFQVDSVTKMEYRVNWTGDTLTTAPGTTNFDLSRRLVGGLLGAMDFTAGQVLRIIVSPIVSAGTIPQVLWLSSFITQDAVTGALTITPGRTITTTATASQVINTYTAPANGCILKDLLLEAISADFFLGVAQIFINGQLCLEFPLQDSNIMTRPIGGIFPFYDGLSFSHGDTVRFNIDPLNSVNQKFQVIIWGDETAETGGGSETKVANNFPAHYTKSTGVKELTSKWS